MRNETKTVSGEIQIDSTLMDRQTTDLISKYGTAPFLNIANPVEQIRKDFDSFYEEVGAPRQEVRDVVDQLVQHEGRKFRVRIYFPITKDAGALPITVFYHGGGMVFGSLDSYDALCRQLANSSGSIFVSVDYSLSPESKFPDGLEDAYTAVVWVHEYSALLGGDPKRIGVCGESAGGNFAAVVARLLRERGGPQLVNQVLIYPVVGTRGNGHSAALFSKGYFFEVDPMMWFYEQYLDDISQAMDPRVSPMLAKDLSSLPSAYIVTAGFDMLRDDAEDYAEVLREAGVPAEVRRYESTIHGFFNMAGVLDVGVQAVAECGDWIRKSFAGAASTLQGKPS